MIRVWEWVFTSSVLTGAMLLLRQLLRGRISRRLQYGLWLAAALRLLIPFSIPAAVSVANVVESSAFRQAGAEVIRLSPAQPDAAEKKPSPSATGEELRLPLAGILWAAGSAAVGGWLVAVNFAFGRRLRRRRRGFTADCPLPVYLIEGIPSPCLFGLLRPAVYLTPEAASPEALRHVLAHECCHYRQRDPFWSLVRALCLILHWWNPLVWAAAICSREDCELACDERTLQALGEEERLAYGKTLLSLASVRPPLSMLGCTATTMALRPGALRRRILLIADAKKPAVSGLCMALAGLLALIGCTFTGARLSPEGAVRQLRESIVCEQGEIRFTIPAGYPDGEEWNIQITGRAAMGEESMSLHLFEQENADHAWKPGGEYRIDLTQTQYQELYMFFSLAGSGEDGDVDLLALAGGDAADAEAADGYDTLLIPFPAYEDAALREYPLLDSVEPFYALIELPEGWRVESPETLSGSGSETLHTPLQIVREQEGERQLIAVIGFNGYTPYEGEDVPPGDRYKTVYPELRLGRLETWDPYTPVRTDADGESGIAEVSYMDPEYMRAHPDADWAAVPVLQTQGILCDSAQLGAYVGIRFLPEAGISEQQLRQIAASLRLQRQE